MADEHLELTLTAILNIIIVIYEGDSILLIHTLINEHGSYVFLSFLPTQLTRMAHVESDWNGKRQITYIHDFS